MLSGYAFESCDNIAGGYLARNLSITPSTTGLFSAYYGKPATISIYSYSDDLSRLATASGRNVIAWFLPFDLPIPIGHPFLLYSKPQVAAEAQEARLVLNRCYSDPIWMNSVDIGYYASSDAGARRTISPKIQVNRSPIRIEFIVYRK